MANRIRITKNGLSVQSSTDTTSSFAIDPNINHAFEAFICRRDASQTTIISGAAVDLVFTGSTESTGIGGWLQTDNKTIRASVVNELLDIQVSGRLALIDPGAIGFMQLRVYPSGSSAASLGHNDHSITQLVVSATAATSNFSHSFMLNADTELVQSGVVCTLNLINNGLFPLTGSARLLSTNLIVSSRV